MHLVIDSQEINICTLFSWGDFLFDVRLSIFINDTERFELGSNSSILDSNSPSCSLQVPLVSQPLSGHFSHAHSWE